MVEEQTNLQHPTIQHRNLFGHGADFLDCTGAVAGNRLGRMFDLRKLTRILPKYASVTIPPFLEFLVRLKHILPEDS